MGGILLEIIPDREDMERELALAERYGAVFEYNDFMLPRDLDDEDGCRKKIAFYKSIDRDRSADTMHGAFIDVAVHSDDSLIRSASRTRVRQSMRIAEELGIRGVVFHTGLTPNFYDTTYRDRWLWANVEFWTKVLDEFPGLSVYVENMFDAESRELARLGDAMAEQERFGVCLDYAHAAVFGKGESLRRWHENTIDYVRHVHMNDNDLKDDLHLPVGSGKIDWKKVWGMLKTCGSCPSVLLEVSGWEAQRRSLEYLEAHDLMP